ncbi:Olfactory receptor 1019 [Lemmus lemmus]
MTNNHQLAVPLFGLFFVIYFITVLGNLGLVVLIQVSHRLHTPMYFFLSNLSFLDVCFSSITIPKTLVNLLSQLQEVSFFGCMAQMGLFIIFASAECNVLPSMAYDRYTAICQPLLYHITMSRVRCLILVAGCYFGGFLNMVAVTSSLTQLSFCQPHVISHFFCDIPPLLALACSDPWVTQILVKAFSTCVSHLTAVALYYGTTMYTYLQPSRHGSQAGNQMVSVFYTMVIPMLNPLIYSLRNQEVKAALKKILRHGL